MENQSEDRRQQSMAQFTTWTQQLLQQIDEYAIERHAELDGIMIEVQKCVTTLKEKLDSQKEATKQEIADYVKRVEDSKEVDYLIDQKNFQENKKAINLGLQTLGTIIDEVAKILAPTKDISLNIPGLPNDGDAAKVATFIPNTKSMVLYDLYRLDTKAVDLPGTSWGQDVFDEVQSKDIFYNCINLEEMFILLYHQKEYKGSTRIRDCFIFNFASFEFEKNAQLQSDWKDLALAQFRDITCVFGEAERQCWEYDRSADQWRDYEGYNRMTLPGEPPLENLPLVCPHAITFEENVYISSAQSTTIIYYNTFTHAFKDLELATPLVLSNPKAFVTDGTSLFIMSWDDTRQVDSSRKTIAVHPGYNIPGSFRGCSFNINGWAFFYTLDGTISGYNFTTNEAQPILSL